MLILGAYNFTFGVEGTNIAWVLLVAFSHYYAFNQKFCVHYCQYMQGWLKVAYGICCLGKTCGGIFCLGKKCCQLGMWHVLLFTA